MKAVGLGAALLAACASDGPRSELPHGEVFVVDVCIDDHGQWPYLVSTRDSLIWISHCDATIRKASKLDGTVLSLASNEPHAAMLAADAEHIYWARIAPSPLEGELVTASQRGGLPTVLATEQQTMYGWLPQQLVVDDTHVYRSAFYDILSIAKDGSASQRVVARGSSGPFLAVDAEYLYWASHSSIHRQRKGTTVDEELAVTSTLWDPIALTATAVFFWWPDNGHLYRVDKSTGGPPIAVVEGTLGHRAFVSDGVANL